MNSKFKSKFALASLFLAMTSVGGLAQAAENSITFNGKIIDEPCTVVVNGGNDTVDLGIASTTAMATSGATSSPVTFTIDLTACSTADATSATIGFTGSADSVMANAMANTGDAANVGVQMKDSAGTIVPIDGTDTGTAAATLTDAGSTSLTYTAYMIDTGDAATAGSVISNATFVVNYQ